MNIEREIDAVLQRIDALEKELESVRGHLKDLYEQKWEEQARAAEKYHREQIENMIGGGENNE